jgi:predicted HAD superfamily Cof-like phosphohydrolase
LFYLILPAVKLAIPTAEHISREYRLQIVFKANLTKNMKQPDALNLVADFHRTFKHPILERPEIPSENRCKLRVALIAEELKELEVAILQKDIVEVADAFCDIQYVLAGAILEFGLGEKFKALFEEVQRSNMSKACTSEEEAKQTVEHYRKKDGTECYYLKEGDKWLVYRKSDNKTIKSVGYSPANLQKIIEQ